MTKRTLRRLVIILSSLIALAGGPAIGTAYALPDGHFGIGHMGDDFGGGGLTQTGTDFAPARDLGAAKLRSLGTKRARTPSVSHIHR